MSMSVDGLEEATLLPPLNVELLTAMYAEDPVALALVRHLAELRDFASDPLTQVRRENADLRAKLESALADTAVLQKQLLEARRVEAETIKANVELNERISYAASAQARFKQVIEELAQATGQWAQPKLMTAEGSPLAAFLDPNAADDYVRRTLRRKERR